MVKCSCGKTMIMFGKGKEGDTFHASVTVAAASEEEALLLFEELVKDPTGWTRKIEIEKQIDRTSAQRQMTNQYIGPSMYT